MYNASNMEVWMNKYFIIVNGTDVINCVVRKQEFTYCHHHMYVRVVPLEACG